MPRGPQLPRDLLDKLQGDKYNDWNQTHNFKNHKSRKQQRKDQRHEKKAGRAPPRGEIKEKKMTAEETMAALAAAKKRKEPVETKPPAKKLKVKPFVSLHEEEIRRKDEEDAKYYAKKLGLKGLKLPKGDDELGGLLGDLDFDRFSDLDKQGGSSSESDPDIGDVSDIDVPLNKDNGDSEEIIENPWTDDSLSEDDFESEAEADDNEDSDEEPGKASEGEFIENPWTDDSLSEGDFDEESGSDEKPQNGKEEFIENPWTDDSLSEDDLDSDAEASESESSGDETEMTPEQTLAALKAAKAAKNGKQSGEMSAEETMAALKAAKEAKSKSADPYTPAGSKYVPPSKRNLAPTKSEEEAKLQRQIKGALNKLAEANLNAIVNEIEGYFVQHTRAMVSNTLASVIIESVSAQGTLQANFLIVHAALVGALYRTVGVDFGAEFIQLLVEAFEKARKGKDSTKQANNLVQLLAECYTMHVVAPALVYDIIRELLGDLNENNTELLLSIVRSCGTQLRSDDPESLKEIIILLQGSVGKMDESTLSSRTKFLVESIVALKNQRQKSANEGVTELRRRLRKVLGGIKGQVSDPLRVTLDDIRNVDTRGKWWIVGAAWSGQSGSSKKDHDQQEVDDMIGSAEPNWLELARKQRLNTDIRRAIFVALMGAEDYIDACQRIDKLHLKNKQAREVPHVILHCCGNEKVYNPYYSLVAAKQCTQHHMRKTMQFTLWDYLGVLENGSSNVQKTMHYARFYASLVTQGALGLDILKNVDFLTANEDLRVFLEVFFVYLFRAIGKQAEQQSSHNMVEGTRRDAKGLAQLLSQTKDKSILRGMQHVLPQVTSSSAVGSGKNADRVRWCSTLANELVQELAAREHSADLGI